MNGQTDWNDPLLAGQLRDLRSVYHWLRAQEDLDSSQIRIWGDSRSAAVPPAQDRIVPRDDDESIPLAAEPSGCMLSLLLSLYEDSIAAICLSGGLSDFHGVLDSPQIRIPHDAVVPGLFTTGDICDLVAQALTKHPLRIEAAVNGSNRLLTPSEVDEYHREIERLLPLPVENSFIACHRMSPDEWLANDPASSGAK